MYYTYAYLREDGTPYYVGKGKEDRIYSTCRRNTPPKDKSRIIFLKQNLTEEEAFKHEIYMIAVLGRKDLGTGILRNLTDGGEGLSGPSPETRSKLSAAQKGENNPFYGKTHSLETRAKQSAEMKGNTNRKGKTHSPETRAKQSAVKKGENNPNYGKTHSPEARAKMSKNSKWKRIE